MRHFFIFETPAERFMLYVLHENQCQTGEIMHRLSEKLTIPQEKSFRNLIKSTRNQIVCTIFRLIWIQTDVRLDPIQSENGKYILISG